jgi:hypothetical protein
MKKAFGAQGTGSRISRTDYAIDTWFANQDVVVTALFDAFDLGARECEQFRQLVDALR